MNKTKLRQLKSKFGNQENIPEGELDKAGLARWGNLIVSQEEHDEMQGIPRSEVLDDDGYQALEDENLHYTEEEYEEDKEFGRVNNPRNIKIRASRERELDELFSGWNF